MSIGSFEHEPVPNADAEIAIKAAHAEIANWQRVFLAIGGVGILAVMVANGALAKAVAVMIIGTGCIGHLHGIGTRRANACLTDLAKLTPAELHELTALASANEGIRLTVGRWLASGDALRQRDLVAAKAYYEEWDSATAQDRAMSALREETHHEQ